ncbi:MAG: cytochrome c [Pseudazoarcus pumilus]|nr:cytochrome c [Pseudazoarcus pumilus]
MKAFGKVSCLAALVLAVSIPAHAGDAARGKTLSTTCAACHGPTGMSPAPAFPNIGGQVEEYLYRALLDYKLGNREDPIMSGQVANLSKQDMQDLAAYYASQSGLKLKR